MLLFETLKNKKSDFQNSNTLVSARDYTVHMILEIYKPRVILACVQYTGVSTHTIKVP